MTHRQIVDLWPSRAALERDLKARGFDVREGQARLWAHRSRIPAGAFVPLVKAARARRFRGVTLDALHRGL